MREFPFHMAPSLLANLLVLGGLVLVLLGLFSRDGNQTELTRKFRVVSLFLGVLLLFYAYGMHSRRTHPAASPQAPPAAEQSGDSQSSPPQPAGDPAPAPDAAVPHPAAFFAGNWRNVGSGTRHVVFLRVEESGDQLTVRAWGSCSGQVCDWGSQEAELSEGAASVSWDQQEARRDMKLLPDGACLRVVLDSAYGGKRAAEHSEERFERRQ
jgi:hypothetical protein